jgi:hypothetical protein
MILGQGQFKHKGFLLAMKKVSNVKKLRPNCSLGHMIHIPWTLTLPRFRNKLTGQYVEYIV